METGPSPLDTFDHVVVLMLENRSFDSILGYLYRDGAPSGKNFEGVVGKELSNPDISGTPIPVSANAEVHQPYPDPGEEFHHVTMQLFSSAQAAGEPGMKGFVRGLLRHTPGFAEGSAALDGFSGRTERADHAMLCARHDTGPQRARQEVRRLRSLVLRGAEPDLV